MNQTKTVIFRAGSFIVISILYVFLLLAFSGAVDPANSVYAATADRIIEKSFDVSPGGLLSVNSRLGKIDVEGWERDEVKVKIEIKGRSQYIDDIEIFIESSADGVDIRSEIPRSRSLFGNWARGINITYTLMVPFEYDVKLRTAGGGISVKKVDGDIDGRTSGGGIRVEDLTGVINLTTSGGGIQSDRLKGTIVMKTSGGSVTVNGALGTLTTQTSGGPIRLSEIDGKVDARTSGGGITLRYIGKNEGINLRTSGGSITVHLPEDVNANISARTSGGGVSTDFPITIQGTVARSSLEGTINNGGPEIVLRTSGGSIRINKN
jgi:DUF4097 and DUF4098 domain-containing protein YvlB